ncbi:MAG: acyltransferase [Alphaproteobacteria bacterium]|nr:acyltransferase [Alphaproteobacteria bacterium]
MKKTVITTCCPPAHVNECAGTGISTSASTDTTACDDTQSVEHKKRFYQIDFIRFLFALMIMYGHLLAFLTIKYKESTLFSSLQVMSSYSGLLIVFSFFIMSGFFLYHSEGFKKYDLEAFAKRRILRLWPILAFSYIPYILIGTYRVYPDTLNLFFVTNAAGLMQETSQNAASWYVCVLFVLSLFFFYALRHFRWEKVAFVCGIIALFGFIVRGTGSTTLYKAAPIASMPFMINGMIEGLAGISLGILIGAFLKRKLETKRIVSKKKKFLFGLFEIAALFFFVYHMSFHKPAGEFIFWEILFIIIFVSFLFEEGFFSRFLNNKFSAWLGDLSYPIYLMHFPMIAVMNEYIWQKPFLKGDLNVLFVSIAICLLASLVADYFVKWLLKFYTKKKSYVKL